MEQNTYDVTVRLSAIWVRRWVGAETSPADWILAQLKLHCPVSDVSMKVNFIRCRIRLADDETAAALVKTLLYAFEKHYELTDATLVVTITVTRENGESVTAVLNSGVSAALEKIRSLIGAPQFKALAEECVTVAAGVKEYGLKDVFLRRAYLVSVNDGCGLTTYLKAFADLIRFLGLFLTDPTGKTVAELKLPMPEKDSDAPYAVRRLTDELKSVAQSVVCIDISEWMDRLTDPVFRGVLRTIDAMSLQCIFFFRVPFMEQPVLQRIRAQLADVLTVQAISIAPFSPEELRLHAGNTLSKRNFSVTPEAWTVFDARIAAEKNDGRFYGIDTVNNVVHEMLYLKLLSNARTGAHDTEIRREDIAELVPDDPFAEASGMEQLDALVGVEAIRQRIMELLAQIETTAKSGGPDRPGIHMRFVGAPGTGKTTVARIMGRILAERGVLRTGVFYEHAGREFCGRFVGQTAPKTAALCRDAYGGVLFVDEAYTLYRAGNEDSPDYGQEAIDTLIAEMENHRSDLLVIFAGYPDEMEKLMEANPGLRSRMPYQLEFPNYTRAQLAEIYFRFAEKHFSFDDAFRAAVTRFFDSLSQPVIEDTAFGNARFVRNLYERTWGKAALRCQLADLPCDTLTAEDFNLAAAEKEFSDAAEKKKIGF